MRALHLVTVLDRGGIEMWLLSMFQIIDRNECQMDICCRSTRRGELSEDFEAEGAKIMHCPLDLTHVKFGNRLRQILREGSYDLVHNHLTTYSGYPVHVAHSVGVPVLTMYHSIHFAPQATLLKLPGLRHLRGLYASLSVDYALRHSDLVATPSKSMQSELDPGGKKTGNRLRVLYYGTEIPEVASRQDREEFRRSLGMAENAPVVMHVGNFRAEKNHAGLLQIFERVLQQIPEVRLVLVGDGSLRSQIQRLCHEMGLDGKVHFLGVRDDVLRLLTLADVFVFPSWSEGFGLVCIEANAGGLPVVASDIPGVVDAVIDGETGILHPPEDIDAMADSVIELIEDDGLARQLGQNGRKRVKEEFSKQTSANRLRELYHECIRNYELAVRDDA